MAALSQPTVGDAIKVMLDQGNYPYIKNNWRAEEEGKRGYIHRKVLKKHFKPVQKKHDISHLSARIGHTPQQEQFVLPFMLGLWMGLDIQGLNDNFDFPRSHGFGPEVDSFFAYERTAKMRDYLNSVQHNHHKVPVDPTSQTDWAIYFAAGLYLRTKIDRFKQAGMLDAPYDQQRAFCDAKPVTSAELYEAEDILDAPYALIKLSHKEWRAIIGIATGLREPAETPYPERMEALKETLDYVRLRQDLKPRFAQRIEAQAAQQGAEQPTR